jgi:hypothetical protein
VNLSAGLYSSRHEWMKDRSEIQDQASISSVLLCSLLPNLSSSPLISSRFPCCRCEAIRHYDRSPRLLSTTHPRPPPQSHPRPSIPHFLINPKPRHSSDLSIPKLMIPRLGSSEPLHLANLCPQTPPLQPSQPTQTTP